MSLSNTDLPGRAARLLEEQKTEWPLLRDGYASLARVRTRTFQFDGFEVQVHFNPGRIASSAAKVDAKSIAARPCFLCSRNRPVEQRAIPLHDDLVLLCNPFPIFPAHFTIPTIAHTPQRIAAIFPRMLELARELSGYCTVFYNGPQSGASAPDHLHLQAGNANAVPAEREYSALPKRAVFQSAGVRAFAVEHYLRRMIAFEAAARDALLEALHRLHEILEQVTRPADGDEPMLNTFTSFEDGRWRVLVFPRARHRPAAYFAEGEARLLLSPGAVDMAGAVIMPVERDFQRITRQDLVRMYDEVTLGSDAFGEVLAALQRPA